MIHLLVDVMHGHEPSPVNFQKSVMSCISAEMKLIFLTQMQEVSDGGPVKRCIDVKASHLHLLSMMLGFKVCSLENLSSVEPGCHAALSLILACLAELETMRGSDRHPT